MLLQLKSWVEVMQLIFMSSHRECSSQCSQHLRAVALRWLNMSQTLGMHIIDVIGCEGDVMIDKVDWSKLWLLTVKPVYKLSNVPVWNRLVQTHMWHHSIDTHFKDITNISMVLEDLFYPSTTCPPIFLPVHIRFYPSKWWVGGSLHKAMVQSKANWVEWLAH